MQLRTVISGHRLLKKPHVATLRIHTQKMNFFLQNWILAWTIQITDFLIEIPFFCHNRHQFDLKITRNSFFSFLNENYWFDWQITFFAIILQKLHHMYLAPSGPFFLIVKGVILMNSRVLNCQKIMTSAYRIISSIFSVIQIFFGKTCFSWMKWSMTISKLFAHFNQGLKTNFLRENWKQDWNGFQVASRYEILTL